MFLFLLFQVSALALLRIWELPPPPQVRLPPMALPPPSPTLPDKRRPSLLVQVTTLQLYSIAIFLNNILLHINKSKEAMRWPCLANCPSIKGWMKHFSCEKMELIFFFFSYKDLGHYLKMK